MNGLALCAGGGGLELGLHIAIPEYRTVCNVEREVYAASVIVARMAEKTLSEAPIWDDLATFDGKLWRGVVDIISAGEPCQPFSHAGQRKGTADKRYLFPQVARIISEVEPEFVFLENVARAVDIRYEHKAVLDRMGYRVEAGLFSAAEVGAPHGRLRIFLLAHGSGGRYQERGRAGLSGAETSGINEGSTADRDGGELANCPNAQYEGCQRGQGQVQFGGSDCDLGGRGLPLWPPRPNDLEAWREVLEEHPEVEPAVCGMANGTSYRVERLQLLGNGVVPLTAALAFVTLFKRLQAQP